jgi:Ca2+-transporting ATPase
MYSRWSVVSSKTKWMATKVETKKTSEVYYYVKGAIESVLPKCDTIYSNGDFKPIKDDMLEQMNNTANQIASEGMRVLALGFGKDHNKLAFVGLVGILDPPRPNVKTAIKSLREHGVRTIMITGDAKATAISIGKELGIWTNDFNVAISPSDIEEDMSKTDLSRVSIFYRMTPSHKSIIVEALQKQGNIVGMLGDGVNDAIALKLADIGIAMGSGTDVCKEASKMVLVDDNFGTIISAIEEGKSIFSGIKNFLRFQLTTSISALAMITFSNLLGYPPPINPMQILFINIIMDGPPAQCLGIEPVDADIIHQPPRNPKDSVVTRQIITSVALNSLIMIIGTLWIYIREMSHDLILSKRDTTMVFATFVTFQFFNALNCRSEKKSLFKIGFFSNRPLCIAVGLCYLGMLAVIYVPFLRIVFETDSLSLMDLLLTTAIASSVFLFEEMIKFTRINQ